MKLQSVALVHRLWTDASLPWFNYMLETSDSIGMDQTRDYTIRRMKLKGRLGGITLYLVTLVRFFLVAPKMAFLSQEVYDKTITTAQNRWNI